MSGNEIREKYLKFMEKNGHAVIPSSALVPENDPTTLFTGSGMQPLVPYLMGEAHPKGTRLTDSQKCFRAEDIEEVGDNRHTTFFEMLGNWSLGDYFKAEQLPWFFYFLVDEVGLDPNKIYVTAFIGDEINNVPKDTESGAIWQSLFKERGIQAKVVEIGSEADGYNVGMQDGRIFYYDAAKNWWSRAGKPEKMPVGEIGGPDSEVFYDFGTEHDQKWGEYCHPNCDCGRFLEIGNSVFMEYLKTESGFEKLPKQNVDFGGGLERITAAANGDGDVFKIDEFSLTIVELEKVTGTKYEEHQNSYRVILDHMRAAVFLLSDGITPSNKDQGYFVRRLIRRAILKSRELSLSVGKKDFFALGFTAHTFSSVYSKQYPVLKEKLDEIDKQITEEETQFNITLDRGMREFEKIATLAIGEYKEDFLRPDAVFNLVTTHGFPFEIVRELAEERNLKIDETRFHQKMQEHQAKSRAGAEHKFKGGLADHSDKVVMYHSCTHLLLAGLRKELGEHVHQAGSNITGERLRFDFTHGEKVERDILDKVEAFVNNAINTGGEVTIEMMQKDTAQADKTIEASFWDRYPDDVKVYTMTGHDGTVFSRELCGGPHVEKLENITGTFKITKEESSAAGIRRIKAVLE